MNLFSRKGVSPANLFTVHEGDVTHTFVMGTTTQGKSIMPDNSELTMHLAIKAFEMIGHDDFSVSANLSADDAESLRNFGILESILLMAYQEGKKDMRQECANICTELAGSKWVSIEAAGECADAIQSNREHTIMEFKNRYGQLIAFNPFDQASIDAAKAKAPGEGIGIEVCAELVKKILSGEVTKLSELPSEYQNIGRVFGLPECSACEDMSEKVAIENPGKVINVLTARVSQLEGQLDFQLAENRRAAPERYADLLRWMRMRAVIPLYVGPQDEESIRKDFVGGELISDEAAQKVFEQVWYLDRAPVPRDVKEALRKAANNGMSRFCSQAADQSESA